MASSLPILYTFRRCPYAMRARLALKMASIEYETREIELKAKPASMLALSPKATVPVLCLPNGQVLEQSLDIMVWAIRQMPQAQQLLDSTDQQLIGPHVQQWIDVNDGSFKVLLDRFKYFNRYPEHSQLYYQEQACIQMLQPMNSCLAGQAFLGGKYFNLADLALFPFVRQFAKVSDDLWLQLNLPHLKKWLEYWLESPEFITVMRKNSIWQETVATT